MRQLVLLCAFCLVSEDVWSHGDSASETSVAVLEARIVQLEKQVEQLIDRLGGTAGSDSPVPGTQSLPEAVATVAVGGRIKADLLANSVSTGARGGQNRPDLSFLPGSIPLSDSGENGQLSTSARDSRFWISATTPTSGGELNAYLELDLVSFDGAGNERVSNSYNPRIRHAYAQFRNYTVGQTTTTFLNPLIFPELNDATGPVGITNVRQPLLRRSWSGDSSKLSLAIEQPETTITYWDGSKLGNDDDRWPDVTGRLDRFGDWGNWSVAVLLRQLRVDGLLGLKEDTAMAYGASVGTRLFTNGTDNIRLAATWGQGIGRYLSYNAFDDVLMDQSGKLHSTPLWAGFIAYQHWWRPTLRSNVSMGIARADIDKHLLLTGVNESLHSFHANLLWSPVRDATVGLEWLYGERHLTDGSKGRLNRIQLTSLYKFRQR